MIYTLNLWDELPRANTAGDLVRLALLVEQRGVVASVGLEAPRVPLGLASIGNPGLDRGPSECYNR